LFTSDLNPYSPYGELTFGVLNLAILGLLISGIYQFTRGRWRKGLFTGIVFIGISIINGLFFTLDQMANGDRWADNLKIPSGIQLETPVDLSIENKRPDSILHLVKYKTDFQLYNSLQPGIFEYDFWIGRIESGKIYIKAFEITRGDALSDDRLPEKSAVNINNPTDNIVKYSTTDNFTIYEGDWGKPYAARFEVWFKPDDNGDERKLFSKNYKIEGWQH
jgi:hypothetical protein